MGNRGEENGQYYTGGLVGNVAGARRIDYIIVVGSAENTSL